MVPERKRDRNFMKDKKIHGERDVWRAAQRQKKTYGYDVHAGHERHNRSVGYGKQCSFGQSCVEEIGWFHPQKGIRS